MSAALVYDDDCGFCTWWAEAVAERSDLRIVGFSALSADLRDRLPADYETCVHLATDDAVYSCGAAAEEAVLRSAVGARARPVVELLRRLDGYDRIREGVYRWVADRRGLWGRVASA